MKINNEMYFQENLRWWDDSDDSPTAFLRHVVNPVRFAYFKRTLQEDSFGAGSGHTLLDVGCGGGFLSEEFAKNGARVTGIDPSPHLLSTAKEHAAMNSLSINYIEGYGERIPLDDDSFDYVACCDVLEHVDDLDKVIGEISRVLKPEGLFLYDTINRTFKSYLMAIKVAQDWKFTAWEQPRTHVWNMFVKPAELIGVMKKYGLISREIKGISPGNNLVSSFLATIRRAQGKISRQEMGLELNLQVSNDTSVQYLGLARKQRKGVKA